MDGGVVRVGDGWRLWDQFAARGAGFPAAGVLRLAPEGLAASADTFGPNQPLSGPDWEAFHEQFEAATMQTVTVLQEIAGSTSFRSAVVWQNRAVLAGIEPLLAWTPSLMRRTSAQRRREELVALYWQRFCVKNRDAAHAGAVVAHGRRGQPVHR